MKRLLQIPLLLLTACGGGDVVSDAPTDQELPVYCIRDAAFLDEDQINGKVLLDMPGYPYGMDDEPMEVSRETYNELTNIDVCKSWDPRMNSQ